MRVGIAWGQQQLELEVLEKNLVQAQRARLPAALADPAETMRHALEHPLNYPALRRALTPEDHVAVLVDEKVPELSSLLVVLLEHMRQAGVQPEAITLLCMPPSSGQAWLDDLPDDFQDVRIEVHQPGDRRKLAYLATTKHDRRIYLNRTAVDADQLVLLTRRGYDRVTGYSGGELALFPGLSDEATLEEMNGRREKRRPNDPSHLQAEAREVAWLLGAPFFAQVIDGPADTIDAIIASPLEGTAAGEQRLDDCWRISAERCVDVVIAGVSGEPARQTMDDLARAFHAASQVVRPGGSIVLLTEAAPTLGPGFELFRQQDDPSLAMSILLQEKPSDLSTCCLWAAAANQAKLYLLSGLKSDLAEELFTIPLQNAGQAQKLLKESASLMLLPDANKMFVLLQ